MNKKALLLGAALTGMVLGISGCASKGGTASDDVVGECHGVNTCKGTGACGGKGHGCAGQNKCKGQGWLKMSKSECMAKTGSFKEK